jgi:hypothetical protein
VPATEESNDKTVWWILFTSHRERWT